jgi:hypothetical protein
MTPGTAIRQYCKMCCEDNEGVYSCKGDTLVTGPCQFYKYRLGKGRPSVKTIRKHCLVCMGNSSNLIKECHTKDCPVYGYREGHNPKCSGRSFVYLEGWKYRSIGQI